MTDSSRVVHKVDQFGARGNMHGAVPCKTLVVFFRRVTKQPVLIPTLQLSKKRGKRCDCLHARHIHMGSPNYAAGSSSSKPQCLFVLTQIKERYICKRKLFLYVSSCEVLSCFFSPMTSPHTSRAPRHRCAFMCSDITFTKTLKA